MLSRVYTTTLVARSVRAAVAQRYMATKPPPPSNPPPKAQATGAAPSKTSTGVPKTTPPSAPTPQKPSSSAPQSLNAASLNSRASNAYFAKARVNLPLRFYNKQGVLASRLYVEAERVSKAEVDKVANALTALRNELTAHPKLLAFLVNAAKTPEQKSTLFNKLGASLKLPPTLLTFLNYMAKTRTSKDIIKVMTNFENLIKARDKSVDVTITLAQADQPKPDSKEIARVLRYKDDTNIQLKVVVDPSIEGGAILSSKDRYLDRSFRRATSAFRQKLEANAQKQRAQKRVEFMKELANFPDSVQP